MVPSALCVEEVSTYWLSTCRKPPMHAGSLPRGINSFLLKVACHSEKYLSICENVISSDHTVSVAALSLEPRVDGVLQVARYVLSSESS